MPDILLLHGAIGAKDQLEQLADKLRPAYTVHTMNFSGHGGEPFNETGFSIPLFADEVWQYLREKNIQRVNILGYSMGGYVALFLARHHPGIIERVITLATKFHWDEVIAAKEIQLLNANTIEQKLPAFAKQLAGRHQPNDWKLVLEKTRKMLVQLGVQNALQPEDYKAIAAPCLLLLGDKDKMVTPEETVAVQVALPHGEYRLLTGTSHPIEQVDTAMLVSLIMDFVK